MLKQTHLIDGEWYSFQTKVLWIIWAAINSEETTKISLIYKYFNYLFKLGSIWEIYHNINQKGYTDNLYIILIIIENYSDIDNEIKMYTKVDIIGYSLLSNIILKIINKNSIFLLRVLLIIN